MDNPCSSRDDIIKEEDTNVSPADILEVIYQQEKKNPEETVGDTRAQLQNILEKFGDVIKKSLRIKRKHMETDVKDCFKNSNRKLEQVWKMNEQERKKLNRGFSKQYMSTFQQWDMDTQEIDGELVTSTTTYRKEQKAFKLSNTDPNQTLPEIRELHEKLMASLQGTEEDSNDPAICSGEEVRKQVEIFQRNIIKLTTKYSLHDKISD